MDWIRGERFIDLAKFTYAPHNKSRDDYDGLRNTLDLNLLNDGDTIYTHLFYVKNLFGLMSTTHKHYVLISHNGDEIIDSSFKWGNNLDHWFTQNVDINMPYFIESLPIGLENERWFKGMKKKQKMQGLLTQPKKYKNLVYMNHNVNTNPSKRLAPYYFLDNKSWVTSQHGVNGRNFDEYIDNVYNHKFVICPEGHGIDTHRTWETLYLGSIPIEKVNLNNQFYKDLPICFVYNWYDITEAFLEEEYERIKSKEWNMDKLNFSYWSNKITTWSKSIQ